MLQSARRVTECQLGRSRSASSTSHTGIQLPSIASLRPDAPDNHHDFIPELAHLIQAVDDLLHNLSQHNIYLHSSSSRMSYSNEASDLLVVLEKIRSESSSLDASTDGDPAEFLRPRLAECNSTISQHSYNILDAVKERSKVRNREIRRQRKRLLWKSMREALSKHKDNIKRAVQFP